MSSRAPRRYETVRDYTLLIIGSFMLISGTVGAIILVSPYALGVIGGGMTALGLIPVFQKER